MDGNIIRTSHLHRYALHNYGAWHGRRENCQRRLILYSAAEYYTTEGQEWTILDICLCPDQCTWATVHGEADACIVTRFIKLGAPRQWQVSIDLHLLHLYRVLIDFVNLFRWKFGDIYLFFRVLGWGRVLNLF